MFSEPWSFLHAADLHIDSPMRGLSAYEGAPVEQLRLATRDAFRNLVELAIQRRVKFVILAGDLFDGDWPDFESRLWFVDKLRSLESEGIRVFAVRGNHDAENRMTAELRWPKCAKVFGSDRPESVSLEQLGVVIHGQSYAQVATVDNLALAYPQAVPGALNIGVLHTALEGREGHGTYAPCSLMDLQSKGYDYWALGHVHRREVVAEDPWVVFPGNIQGRHVRETGAKGVTLVHVEDGKILELEEVACDVARWDLLEIEAAGVREEAELLARWEQSANQAHAAAEGRLLAVRVRFTGSTELDRQLRLDEVRWMQEVRASASRVSPDLWVEKIQLLTQHPQSGGGGGEGLLGLAQRIESAHLDGDELSELTKRFAKLSSRLPEEVRVAHNPGDREVLEQALEPAQRYLAALLSGAGEAPEDGVGE